GARELRDAEEVHHHHGAPHGGERAAHAFAEGPSQEGLRALPRCVRGALRRRTARRWRAFSGARGPGVNRLAKLAGMITKPKPPVGTTPADVIHRENKWRLLRYRP